MDLDAASKFITSHGAAALAAVALSFACCWLIKKLIDVQDARIRDAKESLPLLEKVSTAITAQTELIKNFIAEMRARG